MPLERILEPEVMDTPQEAVDYDTMDHSTVNRVFVDDLLAVLSTQNTVRPIQIPNPKSTPAPSPQFPVPSASPAPSPELPAPFDILDLGTGTALIPIELCKRFGHCRVMAADAAVSMLELARYNVEIHSLTERIQLAQVDAKSLSFSAGMFDVVMSNSIIHHIPQPLGVLREAARVTRSGGILFFRDLLRPNSTAELERLVDTYTAGANDHQRRMFAESLHAALSLDEIRDLIAGLGFDRQSVQQTTDRHWTWSAQRV